MATPLLRIKDASFSYDRRTPSALVFEGLSLDVERGEFLAIMGPSGSGKSTILSLMAGLKSPQKGQVLYEGRDIVCFSEEDRCRYLNREIGMIYQFFNLIPNVSALDNVALPAIIGGTDRSLAREEAAALLGRMGLEAKAKAKAARLSGGEQQRIAIARSFINGPSVILADEPTGNLDHVSTESALKMLCEERGRRGTALVVVTHDPKVALLADRVFEL